MRVHRTTALCLTWCQCGRMRGCAIVRVQSYCAWNARAGLGRSVGAWHSLVLLSSWCDRQSSTCVSKEARKLPASARAAASLASCAASLRGSVGQLHDSAAIGQSLLIECCVSQFIALLRCVVLQMNDSLHRVTFCGAHHTMVTVIEMDQRAKARCSRQASGRWVSGHKHRQALAKRVSAAMQN